MSTIQITAGLSDLESKVFLGSNVNEIVGEDAFVSSKIAVAITPESLSYGDIISVGTLYFGNLPNSDDALISTDGGGTFPFRLKEGQGTVFRLNSEALLETTEVTTVADDSGSLAGTYFDMEDRNGPIRVWVDHPNGVPEISTIQTVADSSDSLDGTYFTIYDSAGSVGVWIDVGDTGTSAPSGATASDRQIEVTGVATDDTAAAVATAVQSALDADGSFSASVSTDTVTVTDAATGTRTDIADGDTGFTVAVSQQGTDSTSAPATPSGGRLVSASLSVDDTATAVATAIAAAFSGDSEISASADTNVATLTDKHPGTRTDATDAGSTGFSINVAQQGADSPTVQVKSVGASTVLYGAAPF